MFMRSFQKVYENLSGHRSPSSHKSRIEEETVCIYINMTLVGNSSFQVKPYNSVQLQKESKT